MVDILLKGFVCPCQDYAHPETRKHIRAFPEFPSGPVQEAWHGTKWLEDAPDDVLTPMLRMDGKDYYIKELVHCRNNSWFIPMRFVKRKEAMWAVGHRVERKTVCQTVHFLLSI